MNLVLALILVTNLSRVAAHVPALVENHLLDQMAQYRADEMCSGNISHDGFVPAYAKIAAPHFLFIGENIAYKFNGADAINAAFLNSPEHRKNELNPIFDRIGVG